VALRGPDLRQQPIESDVWVKRNAPTPS